MWTYTSKLKQSVIYSIGDTHGRGREVIDFVAGLRSRGDDAAYIQLGDLCDGFALPDDSSNEALRADIRRRMFDVPALGCAFARDMQLVNWHKHAEDRDGDIVGTVSARSLLESTDHEEIEALYEAAKVFETLWLFSHEQTSHSDDFYVIAGNHDADLLRGRCRYGRQQKYLLFGLLGFTVDEVCAHLACGTPDVMLRQPMLAWLSERPHMAVSADTVYMHGGPTGALAERLDGHGRDGFNAWVDEIDAARAVGWDHPQFEEHHCFLSPDGIDNDWISRPDRIEAFCDAAGVKYLAVGHSPFLDFEKGRVLNLADTPHKDLFTTPARLRPDGRLIKHDTDMKRTGELWACRHETGSDIWTGIRAADMTEAPLRHGFGE